MHFFHTPKNSINQSLGDVDGHSIVVKREDLTHPIVSGNKFRKLKYEFQQVLNRDIPLVITYGGAFSNHLAATAALGKMLGVQTLGIVRGEEWQTKISESTTLFYCQQQGMQLYCVSRTSYSQKESAEEVQQILKKKIKYKLIPEGGTTPLAIRGCTEILNDKDLSFDVVCVSVGTGGTLIGLSKAAREAQRILGFNALNNSSVENFISSQSDVSNWEINSDYTFGGYAKTTPTLITFMNTFYQQYKIPLDPVYTGKMLFAIFDLIKSGKWKWGKRILVIHTGGLQGIAAMNHQLQKKQYPLISYQKDLL